MAESLQVPLAAVEAVEALHAAVDAAVSELVARHQDRLRCGRGCSDCCLDDLTVFPVEAARIVRDHPDLLATGEPHPPGACAFLDASGACRIYESRPYVCRTQGLPLRWLDLAGEASGEWQEHRDICPLNAPGGPPVEDLPPDACWPLGPVEDRLAALQEAVDAAAGPSLRARGTRRVALRRLFRRSGA
ncbi:MAG: YkgJ family cysteine cluster protein [Deltaproteobacteria bacterium]|nr:YkgJ family cysteine cluster protein [Deltaproteobacteria bacterium]